MCYEKKEIDMKKIYNILVLLLMIIPAAVYGQQEPMFGQYIFNASVINPAQAGGNNSNQAGALARMQWVGFDDAPRTETLFANFRLPHNLGMAVGIYQDRLGPETNLQIQADLAYHATLSDNWSLAGGIRLIGGHMRVSLSDVPNVNPGNPYFQQDLSSDLLLNTGAGLLAYNNRTFFGLSLPKIFSNEIDVTNTGTDDFQANDSRHFFAYAGTNLNLSDEIMFMPSTMFRLIEDAPVQLDLNTVFGYRDVLDFGPMVRTNFTDDNDWFDAVGFLVGITFLEQWYFGYMYEYPVGDINSITQQTHEITLRFSWDTVRERLIRSPRYFL